MPIKWKYLNIFLLFIPACFELGLHAYLGSFSRFLADDFCSYYYAKDLGVFGSAIYWYRTWHGGYSVSFMDSLLVLIGPYKIQYVPAMILLIWIIATTVTIHMWRGKPWQKVEILTSVSYGTVAVYLILLISPFVSQSLYWWGGMRAYIIPIITFTLYLALFLWYRRKIINRIRVVFWSGVSFSIIFAIGGFSETLTPVLLVYFVVHLSLGLLFRRFQPKDQSFYFLLAGSLGAIASLIAMVGAPGNSARQALYPQVGSISAIISIALGGFIEYLLDIGVTPEKISGLIGGIIGIAWAGILDKRDGASGFLRVLASTGAGLVFAYLCFLPAAYGISAIPPARTLIIPTTILIVFFLVAGFLGGEYLTTRIIHQRLIHFGFFIATTILLGGSAIIQARELIGSRHVFIDYARKWDEVDADIMRAKQAGEEIVYIPNMDNWAHLDRPTDNPKFWLTACYTQFYGIEIRGPAWEW